MFTPSISVAALRTLKEKYGNRIYGKYGFADAFNPNNGWVAADVVGIDLGMIQLSAENARSGNVWRWFMQNPQFSQAMKKVGLVRQRQSRPIRMNRRKAA